jgi:hypothetical protein
VVIIKMNPIKIIATVHHVDRDESSYQVSYQTAVGRKTVLIGKDQFYKRGDVVKLLSKKGAVLPDDLKQAEALVTRALKNKMEKHIQITNRSGWHSDSFVYFDRTFGPAKNLKHEGANRINPALGLQHGTVKAAKEGLREPCLFSDYLIFTLSVPAAAPLLDLIGEDEGALYHLHGTSSPGAVESETRTMSTVGKTLGCRVAASATGRCRKVDLTTFAITKKAVEDYCFAHNHLVAIFDEEGRAGGIEKSKAVNRASLPYEIPSGVGTVRSNKATQDQNLANLTWTLLALSNGETPLDEPNGKAKRPEGAQVRMVPLPVPPGKHGGIFNRVTGAPEQISEQCKLLADQVNKTISENYGVIMPAYLGKLVPQRVKVAAETRSLIDQFVTKVGGGTDPWERRFAEKFGIVLVGAILLSRFDLGPWTEERAWLAIETMYRKSRGASVSIADATEATLKRLRKLVKDKSKFRRVRKGEIIRDPHKFAAIGFVREIDGRKNVVLIRYSLFRNHVRPPAVASQVLQSLAEKGIVLRRKDNKPTRQVMIKGVDKKKRRYVCLAGLVTKKSKP